MSCFIQRAITGLTLAAAFTAASLPVQAQYFGDPCGCGQPIAAMPAPIVTGMTVSSPVACQTVAANPCPCLQPVTTMEERQVQVVQNVPVQKTIKVAKVVTDMVEQDVVTYQQVNEVRTASVPSVEYQTVSECRPVTVNRSYWQTVQQPVPKVAGCQYDPRPGFMGAMNRWQHDMRMAMTPNYVTRRQFVPNVVAYNVPVTRQVAVPTTRQVTYNVAHTVPVTKKAQVAVQRTVYEDQVVTVMEPQTITRTVQVPTTRMAYVNPFGGSTATAAATGTSQTAQATPTPAGTQTSESGKGTINFQSTPVRESAPVQFPTYKEGQPTTEPQPTPAEKEPAVAGTAGQAPSIVRVAGWRTSRSAIAKPTTTPEVIGPALPELKMAAR